MQGIIPRTMRIHLNGTFIQCVCVGALLDNAQKLHAVRRRDISIVRHNERPSDVIQYFTPLRHNRPAPIFSPRAISIIHYPLASRARELISAATQQHS